MIRSACIFATIVVTAMAGCTGVPRLHQEVALKALIHKAYKCESGTPSNSLYARHFERGWKQAYYNISKGADACPPSTPPEEYWSVKYQTPEGCRKIAAWYEGYHCGTIAAERDLRPQFANVPVSPLCYRPAAHACQEVPELRSERTGADAAEPATQPEADQADTAKIPTQVPADMSVNLSSYIRQELDLPAPTLDFASEWLQRLPPIESTADTVNQVKP